MGDFGSLMQSGGMMAGAVISCIVVVPFLIVALVFFFIWRRNNQQAQASLNWPSTIGTIGASSVQARTSRTSSGRSTAFYPEVLYQYEVDGRKYLGQRIAFGSQVGYSDSNRAHAIVDRYVPGNQIRVYYNPNNPGDAVLERSAGTSSRIFFWVAILILVILCITVVPTMLMVTSMDALFSSLPFMR